MTWEARLRPPKPDDDFLRYAYMREAVKVFPNCIAGKILDVGGRESPFWREHFQYPSGWEVSPPYPVCDAMKLSELYPPNTFDFVWLEQILEHVSWPQLALYEVEKVLKPNGWVYVATPFLIYVHPDPGDYFRFTRKALENMLHQFFAKDTVIGSWGTKTCALISMEEWPTYREMVDDFGEEIVRSFLEEENDINRPITVFGRARKMTEEEKNEK